MAPVATRHVTVAMATHGGIRCGQKREAERRETTLPLLRDLVIGIPYSHSDMENRRDKPGGSRQRGEAVLHGYMVSTM